MCIAVTNRKANSARTAILNSLASGRGWKRKKDRVVIPVIAAAIAVCPWFEIAQAKIRTTLAAIPEAQYQTGRLNTSGGVISFAPAKTKSAIALASLRANRKMFDGLMSFLLAL